MAAFAVAIVAGIAVANPAGIVLVRALIAMLICYPIGFIVGSICEHFLLLVIINAPWRCLVFFIFDWFVRFVSCFEM